MELLYTDVRGACVQVGGLEFDRQRPRKAPVHDRFAFDVVQCDERAQAVCVFALAIDQVEPVPQIAAARYATLENDGAERHRARALDRPVVASTLLDHFRLHRRFQTGAFGKRAAANRLAVAGGVTFGTVGDELDEKVEGVDRVVLHIAWVEHGAHAAAPNAPGVNDNAPLASSASTRRIP